MSRTIHYDLNMIRDEVQQLVEQGAIDRHQPIYALCRYIPSCEWVGIEYELERNDYLLRDRIIDLIGHEEWAND